MGSEQKTSDHQNRYVALDSLRGVAALIVVFYHCALTLPGFAPALWYGDKSHVGVVGKILSTLPIRVLLSGSSSVLIFFVLSGFVLALPWLNGTPLPYGSFLVRRICRIYIPYAAAIAITLVAMQLIASRTFVGDSSWLLETGWIAPVNARMLVDHILMTGQNNFIDNPIWSLVYEMRVSIIFPLLVIPAVKLGWRGPVMVTAVSELLRFALSLVNLGEFGITAKETLAYVPVFALGVLLATYRSWLQARLLHAPRWLPLLGMTLALLLVSKHWGRYDPEIRGFFGFLAVAFSLSPGLISRALHSAPCAWLGRVSYSLYLVHVPILLSLVYSLSEQIGLLWCIALTLPTALIAAEFFYRFAELPSIALGRRLTRQGLSARRTPTQASLS